MSTATERTYRVPDISCDHCVKAITDEVGPLPGVTDLVVDVEAKEVRVSGGDDTAIRAAIDEAGYEVDGPE